MVGTGVATCQRAGTSSGKTAGDTVEVTTSFTTGWSQIRTGLLTIAAVSFVAACSAAPEKPKAKFSPEKYGVPASPKMVAAGKPVPKGGGRYVVGKKYKIAGKWYYPEHDPNYKKTGLASWYGPTFHGRKTANGEIFDRNALTAAHTTMPLPSYARVTNTANGRSMIVRVNDRGPFHGNRIIDLSERVATMLDTKSKGVGKVKVEYVGRAPLHGQDEEYLMASYSGPGSVVPGGTRPGTLLAQAAPPPNIVFGKVPAPAARPYLVASNTVAAYKPSRSTRVAVAFDPAIAFEAGNPTIKVASNNRFEQLPAAHSSGYAPAGNTQAIPYPGKPTGFVGGSAVSSFAANRRITEAHDALSTVATSGLSMRQLAASIPSGK